MDLRTFDKYHHLQFECIGNTSSQHVHLSCFQNIGLNLPTDNTFIVVENLVTNEECDEILNKSKGYYRDMKMEYLETERQSERFLNINDEMANVLYQRIQKEIENEHSKWNLKPYGFGTDGEWQPVGLNHCFRHSKYTAPSVGFDFHRDACYIHDANNRSVLSVVIYLNDDFDGGETLFVKPCDERKIGQIVREELTNGYDVLLEYKPSKGNAIIFNHNVVHCGKPVTNGTKYIIRTDVLFRNVKPLNNDGWWWENEYFLQAIEYYREANNQEMAGNVALSSELYERGLALRQFHG